MIVIRALLHMDGFRYCYFHLLFFIFKQDLIDDQH